VVRTILLWQITECSLVGRWSFSVMISEPWRFAGWAGSQLAANDLDVLAGCDLDVLALW
jgi:hypothetical protein